MSERYDFQYFRTELRESGVLWVTLDRPERRNAITPAMHANLAPLFERIAVDPDVSVVVLTGAGDKAFSVGADFGGMQENLDAGDRAQARGRGRDHRGGAGWRGRHHCVGIRSPDADHQADQSRRPQRRRA